MLPKEAGGAGTAASQDVLEGIPEMLEPKGEGEG